MSNERKLEAYDSLALRYRPQKLSEMIGQDVGVGIIEGMLKKRKITRAFLIPGPWGSGKCIVEGSMVLTGKGIKQIETLKEVKEDGFHPYEMDILSRKGVTKSSHFYREKVDETFKVRTRFGYEVEGTLEHPLLTINKHGFMTWKCLEDIEVGDKIAIERKKQLWASESPKFSFSYKNKPKDTNSKDVKFPKQMSHSLAKLLGFLVAEGYLGNCQQNVLQITNKDIKLLDSANKCLLDCFGVEGSIAEDPHGVPVLTLSSVQVCDYLRYLGLGWVTSEYKVIPWSILESPKEYVSTFLRSYCEGDAYSSFSKTEIEISTKSPKLGKQLQVVFANFGIICRRVRTKKYATNGKNIKRTYYSLFLWGDNVDKFFLDIGFLSKRKIDRYDSSIKRNTNIDTIPNVQEAVYAIRDKHGDRSGRYTLPDGSLGRLRLSFDNKVWGLTYRKLNKHKHIVRDLKELGYGRLASSIRDIYNSHYFWDEVVFKKLDTKEKYVYDLSVPFSHSFVANGIVNHNTTFARLIAKSVNCMNFDEENCQPCGECKSCKTFKPSGIEGNRDIHEINCALDTGVDQVRAINAQSKFNPTMGRFRIYILDECHMLTNNAQQGLLKPLEEPSGRTIFILCTTNPEKLVDTITSRCKKIIVRPLETKHTLRLLKRVCKGEKRSIDKSLLKKIAHMTNNHARDALQALEAVFDIIDAGHKIKSDDDLGKVVEKATGIPPWQLVQNFLLNLYRGSLMGCFKIAEQVDNPEYFMREVLRYHQNGMYYSMSADDNDELLDPAYRSFNKGIQKLIDADQIVLDDHFRITMAITMDDMVQTVSAMKDYLVEGRYLLSAMIARRAPEFKRKKDK